MIKVKENRNNDILESSINRINQQRHQPEIINSESLIKSLEILAKFDYNMRENITFQKEICSFCNKEFPYQKETVCICESCKKIFCFKHRQQVNHQCSKLNPTQEKYLMNKNYFREKMKQMKFKRG